MSSLRDVVARTLAAEGAVVDLVEPEGLDLLAPPALQRALEIPELARLGFGAELPERAVRVSIESDWIEKLTRLRGDRGRLLHLVVGPAGRSARGLDGEELLRKRVVLQNATYRCAGAEDAWTRCLLLVFRLVAVSDEKREEVMAVCLNEANGAGSDHLTQPLLDALVSGKAPAVEVPADAALPPAWSSRQAEDWCARAMPGRVRARLAPFLAGMERRMAKDLDRLFAYHADLHREAAARREEKRRKGDDDARLRREELRMESIEREYQAKVADLRREYAMSAEIRLVQALRATLPVQRVRLTILRRKGVRPYHLDWNALSGRMDELPCEGCGAAVPVHSICDEQLHIVCADCLSACPACGREFCRACRGDCPRCGSLRAAGS